LSVNNLDRIATVDFDGRVSAYTFDQLTQLELAYAVTVHKSQGCEFDYVIMPLMGGFNKLAYRSLLYTAVTRAKQMLIIIGKEDEIYKMVDNNRGSKRYTCLKEMIDNSENTDSSDSEELPFDMSECENSGESILEVLETISSGKQQEQL
ncbi:MAG: ATP-binding domain-containing protein, partial [Ruminococcus sp.]|nr:ATP-binding domain-containing protein [Ruminococcus sp.]